MFPSIGILIALAAVFSIINHKYLKWPTTIGLMFLSLITAGALFLAKGIAPGLYDFFCQVVTDLNFEELLLDIMLSFLLFAGALHTNFNQLKVQKWPVLIFSTLGVLFSTFLVGFAIYYLLPVLGMEVKLVYCLLFGALISPTDPIAVLSILKQAGAPKKLETKIVGESLFNDGVGIVVFISLLSIATTGAVHSL